MRPRLDQWRLIATVPAHNPLFSGLLRPFLTRHDLKERVVGLVSNAQKSSSNKGFRGKRAGTGCHMVAILVLDLSLAGDDSQILLEAPTKGLDLSRDGPPLRLSGQGEPIFDSLFATKDPRHNALLV